MTSRKTIIVIVAVSLLLIGTTPRSVSADITGNVYSFSAYWYELTHQIDGVIVHEEVEQGDFQLLVYNITPGDDYEYTFTGLNWHFFFGPYVDERNGSVDFQDNKVYFNIDTVDFDADNLTEFYDIDMYPYYHEGNPGAMFFVNPVWTTHNTDWTDSVDDATAESGVSAFTESANEGSFSFQATIGIEYNHSIYNYMNGTATISFNAAYDTDGVLNSWSLQQVRSATNENHSVVETMNQAFVRGAGAGAPYDASLGTSLAMAGGAGVIGLVAGVLIARKYWK